MGVGLKPYDPEGSTLHKKSAKWRLDGSLAHRCSLASPLGEARKQKTGHQSRGGTTAWEGWGNRLVFVARTHTSTFLCSLIPLSRRRLDCARAFKRPHEGISERTTLSRRPKLTMSAGTQYHNGRRYRDGPHLRGAARVTIGESSASSNIEIHGKGAPNEPLTSLLPSHHTR